LEFWAPAFAGVHITIVRFRSLPHFRHPGPDPGSRFFAHLPAFEIKRDPGSSPGWRRWRGQLPVDSCPSVYPGESRGPVRKSARL